MTSFPFLLSYIVLWVLVIFQGLMLLGVTRTLYRRGVGETVDLRGRVAPRFQAVDLSGELLDSRDFLGQLTALLFVSPSCPSCNVTLDELGALDAKVGGNVLIVCRADADECRQLAGRLGNHVRVVSDERSELANLFAVASFPTAVLIDADNKVQSHGEPKRGTELATIFGSSDGQSPVEVLA